MTSFEKALEDASELVAAHPLEALERAGKMVEQSPRPRAFRIAAAALRALDRHEEAARAELEGIRVGFTPPLKEARAAQQERRSGDAKSIAEEYLKTNPDDLLALTIAAEAALGLRNADEAEPMLRKVVDRAPDFPPASLLLANALAAQLRLREAADVLEKLLIRIPHEPNVKRRLADIRAQMNDPNGAAGLYKKVLDAGQNNPADWFKYAQNLRAAGERADSVNALRQAIALAPLGGHAWWALAHYFPDELTGADEQQIREALGSHDLRPSERSLLQVAVSILEDRRGNHEAAFGAIESAKSVREPGPVYDPDALSRQVDELIAAYTPDLLARYAPNGSTSQAPIFIVGMPRSGSTLVERILGQHSTVEALGEIRLIPRLLAAQQPDGIAGYRSLLPGSITGETISNMAEWYLARTSDYRKTNKPRFTDKHNANWISVGLIRLMFPNARILDVRRNALDCCWSIFRTMMADDYAGDQRHLARYYADYVRLMGSMAATAPGAILTVCYEELVADLEGQTRRMLDFLGLGFEKGCVDFHLSTSSTSTPSSEQVRRPINSEGIGSAEPYRPWLQPLIDELEAALPKGS